MYASCTTEPAGLPFFLDSRLATGDFPARWERARREAIRSVLSGDGVGAAVPEEELLGAVPAGSRDALLRAVFDNSRRLGMSLARYLGLSADVADFAAYLPSLGIPCFRGDWISRGPAGLLRRSGCHGAARLGSLACDYWREALDGLVTGASAELRLARHRSRGHGDGECLDIIFPEVGTGPQLGLHKGNLPEDWMTALGALVERYARRGVSLKWEGYSEGVLYYRMIAEAGALCGAGGRLLRDSVASEVHRLFPGTEARDGSPVAVYGGAP